AVVKAGAATLVEHANSTVPNREIVQFRLDAANHLENPAGVVAVDRNRRAQAAAVDGDLAGPADRETTQVQRAVGQRDGESPGRAAVAGVGRGDGEGDVVGVGVQDRLP